MPELNPLSMVEWFHLVALALGAGGAASSLLISGLEEDREDMRGLAAALWAKVSRWAFRLALITALAAAGMQFKPDFNPLKAFPYLWWMLPLELLMVVCSEAAPKALARGKRGAGALALVLFLLATFVWMNRGLFTRKAGPAPSVPAAVVESAPR